MIEFNKRFDIPKDFTGTCKVTSTEDVFYMKDGKRHNEAAPAIICKNGTKIWYLNDLQHREDGPAVEYANGECSWFYKGKYYGFNDEFTNETCKEKVKELKYLESLNIFK